MTSAGGAAPFRTAGYGALALLAFAANSVLCRLALRHGAIDPATFSTIRLASGAAMLLLVATQVPGSIRPSARSWTSAGILVLYALPFSFAYTNLTAGTGALILFGCVQATMLVGAMHGGERLRGWQWMGLSVALAGLVYLVLPGLAAPSLPDAALMALAGIAWAMYSLRGRGSPDPLAQTTANFVCAMPFVLVANAVALPTVHVEARGLALAVASGAVASGLGYVAWYGALRGLTATRAAVAQLSVPVLAAAGGVAFLGEPMTLRLAVSSMMVLGGIVLAIAGGKTT